MLTHARHAGDGRRHREPLHQDAEGLLPAGRHRPDLRLHPAAADISFEAMAKLQQQALEIVLADPAVAGVGSSVGASGWNASVNQGRMFISLKPLSRARRPHHPARHRPPAPRALRHRGPQRLVLRRPGHSHRRAPGPRRSTSSRFWSPDFDALYEWVPKVVDRLEPGAGAHRRLHRPRAGRPAGQHHRSTGRRPRGSASRCRTSTAPSTTPSRSARSPPSTPSATSTASSWRSIRASSATRPISSRIFVPGRDGVQVPLDSVVKVTQTLAPAGGQPPGAVPGRHHQLRPDRRHDARRRRRPPSAQAIAELQDARLHPRRRRRRRQGLPAAGQHAGAPHHHRAARRLHRAGRAVREPGASRSPSSPRCPRRGSARWSRCGWRAWS